MSDQGGSRENSREAENNEGSERMETENGEDYF